MSYIPSPTSTGLLPLEVKIVEDVVEVIVTVVTVDAFAVHVIEDPVGVVAPVITSVVAFSNPPISRTVAQSTAQSYDVLCQPPVYAGF